MLEEEAAKHTLDQVVTRDSDLKGIPSPNTIHGQIDTYILKILLDRSDQLYVSRWLSAVERHSLHGSFKHGATS